VIEPGPIVGAQLYTVRESMAADPLATLRRVADLGYREVEIAGTFGAKPEAICQQTRALELRVAAVHADWPLLRTDPAAAIAETRALCSDTLILAWLPEDQRQTLAQWRDWVEHLNLIADLAEREGVRIAYHAHDFEFAEIDGIRPIDLLMDELDPRIGFELDTYWLAYAGEDSLRFLRRHADRVTHLHLKDMAGDGSMADVGEGTLPLAQIIIQAQRQGVRHFLVERDDASDPWASLAASLDSLRAMPLQQDTTSNAFRSANP
jgi:sugar phosphate isomerase/epimerase